MPAALTEQEASEIQPSPGIDGDVTQDGGGSSTSPRGRAASDAQHLQHSGSGHGAGRGDGIRSRGGSAATAGAGSPAAGGGGGGREGAGAPGEGLLPSMDVFSLGCVIAEVGGERRGGRGVGDTHLVLALMI